MIAKTRMSLLCLLLGALVLFAVLMMVATCVTVKIGFAGVFGFLVALLAVWQMFDVFSLRSIRFQRYEGWILTCFCFAVHIALIRILPQIGQDGMVAPGDSMAAVMALEAGKICHMHELRNVCWCNYEILLSSLGLLLTPSEWVGKLLNAICGACSVLVFYRLSFDIAGRRLTRFLALLMGLYPPLLFYSTILNSEFLSSSLLFVAVFFLLRSFCAAGRLSNILRFAAVAGVFLALSSVFKTLTAVVVVSMVLVAIILALESRNRLVHACLVATILTTVGMCQIVRPVAQNALLQLCNNSEQVSCVEDSSPLLYELVLGLNLKTEGTFDGDLAKRFLGLNPETRWAFLKKTVKRDWRSYPELMVRKFTRIHGSHCNSHGAVSHYTISFRPKPGRRGAVNLNTPRWSRLISDAATVLFRVLFILGAVGLLLRFASDPVCRAMLLPGMLSAAIILAFACVEQLIEGHGRYKTAIYPFYFLILPYCRVWFERDNMLYCKIKSLKGVLGR